MIWLFVIWWVGMIGFAVYAGYDGAGYSPEIIVPLVFWWIAIPIYLAMYVGEEINTFVHRKDYQ